MSLIWKGVSKTPINDFSEYIKACFNYEEDSGLLYWKSQRPDNHFKNNTSKKRWETLFGGKLAGHVKKGRHTEYFRVKLLSSTIESHTIIWVLLYGKFPDGEIDHIDGDGLNNKRANLRDHSNTKNKRKSICNKSGRVGVHYHKGKNCWVATGGRKHIGQHEDFEEACKIRYEWEILNGVTPDYRPPVVKLIKEIIGA